MLITVDVHDLKVGMYVDRVDIPWFHHPFWRRKFLLRSSDEIEKLLTAGVRKAVIDDRKGMGLPAVIQHAQQPVEATPQSIRKPLHANSNRASVDTHGAKPERLHGRERAVEVRRATKLLNRSKNAVVNMFSDARMGKAVRTKGVANLVEQISQSVGKDPTIILNIARLKSKDEYTFLHSVSVCALMINLSRQLKLDETSVHEMGMAGMLHDVGKMAIPDDILNKPGRLDDTEFALVRNHPQRGFEILSASNKVSPLALDVCLSHHEKMDGTGYPSRTKGEDLSLAVRMAAICDVYDAVTSQRSYNTPWTASEALYRMLSWKGHFDQLLLKAFVESLGIWPVGTVVLLTDNRLAIVIGEDPIDCFKPVVRVFFSVTGGEMLPSEDLLISNDGISPNIVAEANPDELGLKNWSTLSAQLLVDSKSVAA